MATSQDMPNNTCFSTSERTTKTSQVDTYAYFVPKMNQKEVGMRYAFFIDLDVVNTPELLQKLTGSVDGKIVWGKLYNYRPTKHKGLANIVKKYQFSLELAPKGKSQHIDIRQAVDSVEWAMSDSIDGILLACKQRDCGVVANKISQYDKVLTLVVNSKGECGAPDKLICLDEWQELKGEQEMVADDGQKFNFLPYTKMQCEQDLTALNAKLGELIEQKSAKVRLKKVKNDKLDELIQKYF